MGTDPGPGFRLGFATAFLASIVGTWWIEMTLEDHALQAFLGLLAAIVAAGLVAFATKRPSLGKGIIWGTVTSVAASALLILLLLWWINPE